MNLVGLAPRLAATFLALGTIAASYGCSSDSDSSGSGARGPDAGTGGSVKGAPISGGATSTGGAPSGGAPSTGGTTASTGGSTASGGTAASGGTTASGGGSGASGSPSTSPDAAPPANPTEDGGGSDPGCAFSLASEPCASEGDSCRYTAGQDGCITGQCTCIDGTWACSRRDQCTIGCNQPLEARCGGPCEGSPTGCLCACGGGGNFSSCCCVRGTWQCGSC